MIVAEWIGDVTERLLSYYRLFVVQLVACRLPIFSSFCSRLVPLSHVHLFPICPLQVLLRGLTRVLHFMTPPGQLSQVEGTSAQLFCHEVYYYRLRSCPRPHALYNLGYLVFYSHS